MGALGGGNIRHFAYVGQPEMNWSEVALLGSLGAIALLGLWWFVRDKDEE